MQVSQANNVKVYNLSAGKSLPEWISDRKKRLLLKKDVELRRRIELIQDFDMPTASNCVRVTPDGQYILTSGVYKPRVKCYDVNQLSIKFDRCFDSECIKFEVLSDDYSKLVLLQTDRYVEFHAQYGRYYRTRMPKYGRDLSYHKPSCDLYLVGDGSEVFRLNLAQGRYLEPFDAQCSSINVCEVNPLHQMLSVGTSDGKVVCFDPRSRTKVGVLDISESENNSPEVTALTFKNGLEMAVGCHGGSVLLYDIRSNKARLKKSHAYELPIKKLIYHASGNLVSCDSKIIKIWNSETGDNFTSIEPGITINDLSVYLNSGLMLLANEASKNLVYYVPSLGQAPRWCSFLDSITEELEESDEVILYDDYKFVTSQDLENLGLSHLRGTNVLRAYMHGYFIDIRLYHKAKSIVEPFAYEEYRRNRIREKLEEGRASRIKINKMPKVNRLIAERLLDDKNKKNPVLSEQVIKNPLGDDRFAAMFTNKDYHVDMESEEYKLLHPVVSKHEKEARRIREEEYSEDEADEKYQNLYDYAREDGNEANENESEIDGFYQDIENEVDENINLFSEQSLKKESKIVKKKSTKSKISDKNAGNKNAGNKDLTLVEFEGNIKTYGSSRRKHQSLGDMLDEAKNEIEEKVTGTALGSRELTFKVEKKKRDTKKDEENEAHKKERKKIRRSTGQLLKGEKKAPVFWRGKKVK